MALRNVTEGYADHRVETTAKAATASNGFCFHMVRSVGARCPAMSAAQITHVVMVMSRNTGSDENFSATLW